MYVRLFGSASMDWQSRAHFFAAVAREMRAESDVPILIVSGERDPAAPAELLDLGADDYIRKSMPNDEKLARIRAAVKRAAKVEAP